MAKFVTIEFVTTTNYMDPVLYAKLFPEKYEKQFHEKKIRSDGRTFDEIRNMIFAVSTSTTSIVKIGNTCVVAGVTLAIGTPPLGMENEGEIELNTTYSPMCSTSVTIGRPVDKASCINSYVQDILKASNVVDLEQLSIEKGKAAWKVTVHLTCVDDDGSVLDAALVGVLKVLGSLELPETKMDQDGKVVLVKGGKDTQKLVLHSLPICTSFAVYDEDLVVVDPNEKEETIAKGVVVVCVNGDGMICGVDKFGGCSIAPSTIQKCMTLATARAEECNAQLLKQE